MGNATFEAPPNQKMSIVLDNSNAILTQKTVAISSYFLVNASTDQVNELSKGLSDTVDYLQHYILSDDFNISLAPCGTPNAFSITDGGDITLCTELIFDSISKGVENASLGVFAHELGHTYLNLWGSPHYANEKSADEFAVALLFITENFPPLETSSDTTLTTARPNEVIGELIRYFESVSNLNQEVQAALVGGPHPLTAQRINTLRDILSRPQYFVKNWVSEIYPHLTRSALESIIQEPHIGADVELAKKLLLEKSQPSFKNVNKNEVPNQIVLPNNLLKKLEAYAILNDLETSSQAAEEILTKHFESK